MNLSHNIGKQDTIYDVIKWGEKVLKENQRPDSHIDAKLLMLYVLNKSETQLLLTRHQPIEDYELEKYRNFIQKRAKGIPLQHITGEQEFMGINFYVNKHVLIPRQDTETLVECILKENQKTPLLKGIDIGTGTGCIGISLCHYLSNLQMTLIDISKEALEVAQRNVDRHNMQDRIKLLQSDCLEDYKGEKVDLIVSNPPYISKEDMLELMVEVKDYEPRNALTDEGDGLYFYRLITKKAKAYLNKGGLIAYEIGYNQGEAVSQLLLKAGYDEIRVLKDLLQNDRVVIARNN